MGNTVPGEAGSADLGLESWFCRSLAGKLHQLSEPQFALLYDGDNNAFFPEWLRRDTMPIIQYVLKNMEFVRVFA